MARTKKLRVTLWVAVAVIMILSGCAGNTAQDNETGESTANNDSTQKQESNNASNDSTNNTEQAAQDPLVDPERLGGLKMPLTSEPISYTWQFAEHPTYPVNEDEWVTIPTLEKLTNVDIKLQPLPDANYEEKISVQIASGDLPDITLMPMDKAKEAGMGGLTLALDDYIDQYAPNLKAFLDKRKTYRPSLLAADGKLYGFPIESSIYPIHAWLIRKDIFDKEGLSEPQTMDELLDVMRKLKEKYPDSSPFSVRNSSGGGILEYFAPAYGIGDELFWVEDNKAVFTPEQPQFFKMLTFVNQLYQEKLLDQDYPVVTTEMWQERMAQGKALITFDWNTRAEFYNDNNAKAQNPIEGYNLVRMLPPIPEGGKGQLPGNFPLSSKTITLSKDIENPEVAVQLLDTFYSDFGTELIVWGLEGVTWERNEQGGYKYTDKISTWYNENENAKDTAYYGINYNGFLIDRYQLQPNDTGASPIYQGWMNGLVEKDRIQPAQPEFVETEEEQEEWAKKFTTIETYYAENMDQFIMGKRPLSEWNDFLQEIKKLGVEDLLNIKQAQIDRNL